MTGPPVAKILYYLGLLQMVTPLYQSTFAYSAKYLCEQFAGKPQIQDKKYPPQQMAPPQNYDAPPQSLMNQAPQAQMNQTTPKSTQPAPIKQMTIQERQTLGHNINFLNTDQLMGIYEIVKDSIPNQSDTLEFDLKELSDLKCRELEEYVNICIKQNQADAKQQQVLQQQAVIVQNQPVPAPQPQQIANQAVPAQPPVQQPPNILPQTPQPDQNLLQQQQMLAAAQFQQQQQQQLQSFQQAPQFPSSELEQQLIQMQTAFGLPVATNQAQLYSQQQNLLMQVPNAIETYQQYLMQQQQQLQQQQQQQQLLTQQQQLVNQQQQQQQQQIGQYQQQMLAGQPQNFMQFNQPQEDMAIANQGYLFQQQQQQALQQQGIDPYGGQNMQMNNQNWQQLTANGQMNMDPQQQQQLYQQAFNQQH